MYRLVSLMLILALMITTGCSSSPKILFMSEPPGAVVTAGGRSCTTPCEMKVPLHTSTAIFSHHSTASREVSISHLTRRSAATRYGFLKTGEYSLATLGVPLVLAGGAFAFFSGSFSDSESIESDTSSDNDDASAILGGALIAGGAFLIGSDYFSEHAEKMEPVIMAKLDEPMKTAKDAAAKGGEEQSRSNNRDSIFLK